MKNGGKNKSVAFIILFSIIYECTGQMDNCFLYFYSTFMELGVVCKSLITFQFKNSIFMLSFMEERKS